MPGQKQQFDELIQQDYRRLFGYVLSVVHHLDDTQDIVQETCRTLWEKFDEYDASQPFSSWAIGFARYKVLQHLERARRGREGLDSYAAERIAELWQQSATEQDQQRVEALRSCISKLDEQQRSLVQQCYDGTSSVREVAQRLGRSASSLHNTLNRIRQQLLECIRRTLATEAGQ